MSRWQHADTWGGNGMLRQLPVISTAEANEILRLTGTFGRKPLGKDKNRAVVKCLNTHQSEVWPWILPCVPDLRHGECGCPGWEDKFHPPRPAL